MGGTLISDEKAVGRRSMCIVGRRGLKTQENSQPAHLEGPLGGATLT